MYFISPLKYYCHWWWFELWTQYPGSVVPLAMFRTVPREKMTTVSIFSELTPKKNNRTWCSSWLILTFVFQSIYNNLILHVTYGMCICVCVLRTILQLWNCIWISLEIFQLGMAKNYKNEWLQKQITMTQSSHWKFSGLGWQRITKTNDYKTNYNDMLIFSSQFFSISIASSWIE